MRIKAILSFGMVLGGGTFLAACGAAEPVHEYSMDYPEYESISELCDAASLIVTGKPIGSDVRKVNILSGDQGDTPEENPALGADDQPDDVFMVKTITKFKVDDVMRGRDVQRGDVIEVGQPGGAYEGTEYRAQQYSLSERQTHLLFLMEFDDAPASLLNPSQAGFTISDGLISSDSVSNLTAAVAGRSADSQICG